MGAVIHVTLTPLPMTFHPVPATVCDCPARCESTSMHTLKYPHSWGSLFFSVHPLTPAAILKTADAGTLDILIITLEQIHTTRSE